MLEVEKENISYSLNYSQGDGCSFTCNIEGEEVLDVLRVMSPIIEIQPIKRVRNLLCLGKTKSDLDDGCDITMQIFRSSSNYCHENTISMANEIDTGDMSFHEDLDSDDPILMLNVDRMIDFYDALSDQVMEYAKDCCRQLQSEGETIFSKCPYEEEILKKVETKNYILTVSMMPSDDSNTWIESESEVAYCHLLAKEEGCLFGELTVKLKNKTTGNVRQDSWPDHYLASKKRVYLESKCLIKELVEDERINTYMAAA